RQRTRMRRAPTAEDTGTRSGRVRPSSDRMHRPPDESIRRPVDTNAAVARSIRFCIATDTGRHGDAQAAPRSFADSAPRFTLQPDNDVLRRGRLKSRYPFDVVQHVERLNGRERIDIQPPYLVAYLDKHGVFQLEHAELYARKMFPCGCRLPPLAATGRFCGGTDTGRYGRTGN